MCGFPRMKAEVVGGEREDSGPKEDMGTYARSSEVGGSELSRVGNEHDASGGSEPACMHIAVCIPGTARAN
jgi:hypothetical protein